MHTQTKFRLLVVRLGAMGDILHALPAVMALRLAHPAWEIGWVVEPRWRALLAATGVWSQGTSDRRSETGDPGSKGNGSEGNRAKNQGAEIAPGPRSSAMPLVDRVHFAPAKEWGKNPLTRKTICEIKQLRGELRTGRYDVAIDLQGAVRSAAIARMAGSRRLIGEAKPREWLARWLFTERVATCGAHVIEQDVELAAAVAGDELVAEAPLLPVDPAAERWCDKLLGAGAGQPVALITPGAGWGAKRWPVEGYAVVAAGLAARGLRVLVNAGPGEDALGEAIAASGAATPVAASLDELIALTRRIALCIAGDTGPLHLASALGRPVVGIYGPTDPIRNGPFGTRATVLRSPASRRDHTRRATPEAGLLTIEPSEVLRAADALLAGRLPDV